MTIAEEIYKRSIWGKQMPLVYLHQVETTTFKKGSSLVTATFDSRENCLVFTETHKGRVCFVNRLWQDGRKS